MVVEVQERFISTPSFWLSTFTFLSSPNIVEALETLEDSSDGAPTKPSPSAWLPTELIIKIVLFSLQDQLYAQSSRHRTRYLAKLRLVSTAFDEIAQREIFRSLFVTSPHQLATLSEFYASDKTGKRSEVEELNVSMGGEQGATEGKRGGGKEWRKAIRGFCALCPKLRRVSITGPERNTGAFFCADWLEGAKDTLTHITLYRLSVASYPEVATIRFPAARSLALLDCRPYARSQLPSFYSHFPHLGSLELDNENIEQTLVEGALASTRTPPFLPTLRYLTIPQAPFLRLFTPSLHARNDEPLSDPPHTLPSSLRSLTLLRVTFPETLLPPFLQFAKKYAEFGGCHLSRIEVEVDEG